MKLYNANFSPNALRVRAVVYELGIEVEKIEVDIRGGNRTPEYLKLNPNGKVPVLVDGDTVIWESRAINAYLASKFRRRGCTRPISSSARPSTSGPTGRRSIWVPRCRRLPSSA